MRVEAIKLTRSFMNATLDYRIILRNRTDSAVNNIAIGAKLVAAHGALPVEQQIAGAHTELDAAHRIERLSPSQSKTIEGKLTLPLSAIQPIRQGNASLFVPILQLRADGPMIEPVIRSTVIGQVAAGGTERLQPFNLGDPPQSYAALSQRALD